MMAGRSHYFPSPSTEQPDAPVVPTVHEPLRARPIVAAFDLDGTLTRGGSVTKFLQEVGSRPRVYASIVRHLPGIVHAALTSGLAADRVKESIFMDVLAGEHTATVSEVARRFSSEHLAKRLRPETLERVAFHKERGHAVVVISASPEVYVHEFADRLGATGAIATRLAEGGGILTGRYAGRNCRGREKYTRLLAWIRTSFPGSADAFVYAYGNSRGDLSLLEFADVGVNMGRLGRIGRLNAFPRVDALGGIDREVDQTILVERVR